MVIPLLIFSFLFVLLFYPIPIYINSSQELFVFGFRIKIKKRKEKISLSRGLKDIKIFLKAKPILSEMCSHIIIDVVKIEQEEKFNPFLFAGSYALYYGFYAFLDETFLRVFDIDYHLSITSQNKFFFDGIFLVKMVDIIVVLIKNIRRIGGLFGTSHS